MKVNNRAHAYFDNNQIEQLKKIAEKKGVALASLIRMIVIEYLDSLKIKTK